MSAVLQSEVIVVLNDPDALFDLSLAEKWGDGLPLIPPTDDRIEAMLAGTPREGKGYEFFGPRAYEPWIATE